MRRCSGLDGQPDPSCEVCRRFVREQPPSVAVAGALAYAACLLLLVLAQWLWSCVGKPAICATTWSASTGVEQSVYDGRVHPTAEVSVGGELGSDRCKETSDD